jgi:predicted RNA-binding protein Jag
MSEKWIEVEGADLAQALEKAASELGLDRDSLDYDFDMDHFKGGASTVRILVAGKDPQADELGEEIESRVLEVLEDRNLEAQVSVRITVFAAHIELRATESGVSDEPFHPFVATLKKELAGLLEGRDLRVALRDFGPDERFEAPRRDRRGRPDDRRGRFDDRRGRSNDRGRFGRGPRRPPRDDQDERDERIRGEARSAVEKVMRGEGPASLNDLNSYERRLVHMVVREFDGVESHSVGEGTHKEVLIERVNSEE